MELTMLRLSLIAAGVLTAFLIAPALTVPQATAAAPKCKTKVNKYVACTDKLKAKSHRRTSDGDVDGRDFLIWQRGHNRPHANMLRAGH
jgi:hypothetical protein